MIKEIIEKAKELFRSKGNRLIVKDYPQGGYFYSERLGIDSTAFILYDKNTRKWGLIQERKPPMDERIVEPAIKELVTFQDEREAFMITAFGGSNDGIDMERYAKMNQAERIKHFAALARTECREEAGYNVDMDRVNFEEVVFVSTQQNQMCYLYAVDVTDIEQTEADPQSAMEAAATVVWLTEQEVQSSINDWKAKTIVFQENMV